jgi:hypothetical protein
MKDYVVYHNPDKMGGRVRDFPSCEAVTGKTVKENVIGSRVWLITGEGKPRTFLLRSCFIVDQVLTRGHEEYKTKLTGSDCRIFEPMIELEGRWFHTFKRKQGNFSRGFQVIDADSVLQLEKLGA